MKRLLPLLLLLLLIPVSSWGQNIAYSNVAFRQVSGLPGYPASGATITVCGFPGIGVPCTNTVSIFGGPAGGPLLNPFTADGFGNFSFWTVPGNYTVTITGSNMNGYAINISITISPTSNITFSGNNIFSGSNTHNGTETFLGPLVNTGTDSGNQTIAGNKIFSGGNTHNGAETFTGGIIISTGALTVSSAATFTGATVTKNFNTIRYASQYAGADFCTQANNADADIGANPGEIWIDGNVASTACAAVLVQSGLRIYRFVGSGAALNNFTIPMGDFVFTQQSLVDCGVNLRTNLTFTGSGNEFFFKWAGVGSSYDSWGYGVQNCRVVGPGGLSGNASSAGNAFQIGDATHAGTQGLTLYNVHSYGAAIDISFGSCSGSFGTYVANSSFHSQQTLNHTPCSGGAIAENLSFVHDIFTANSFSATGVVTNSVNLGGTGLVEINFKDVSFDGAQVNNTGARARFEDCHFENPAGNVASATTYYLIQGAGTNNNTTLINPLFIQDSSSGTVPNAFINQTGGNLDIYGYEDSTNATMPESILVSAGAGAIRVFGVKNLIGTHTNGLVSGLANAVWGMVCPDSSQICTYQNVSMKLLGTSGTNPLQIGTTGATFDWNGGLQWQGAETSDLAAPAISNRSGRGIDIRSAGQNNIIFGTSANFQTSPGATPVFQVLPASIGLGSTLFASTTVPTIAAAGCGGAAAAIIAPNGTISFKINVGTTPGSACTITMPTATTGWNCFATDITTNSTSVFLQKQTGAESQTSVTITNFNDVAAATAFVASDILKVSCHAD